MIGKKERIKDNALGSRYGRRISKKKWMLVPTLAVSLLVTGCGTRQAWNAFQDIGHMTISDDTILTDAERQKMTDLQNRRATGIKDWDTDDLIKLKSDWAAFRDPIEEFIKEYNSVKGSFFTDEEKKLMTSDETKKADELMAKVEESYKVHDTVEFPKAVQAWKDFSGGLREAFEIYNSINWNPFSKGETELLYESDKTKMKDLTEKLKQALKQRDVEKLKSLRDEWNNDFIPTASSNVEKAKTELLNKWVNSANLAGSLSGLFSLGQISTKTAVNGHTITITQEYKSSYYTDSQIKSAMNSYISLVSSVMKNGIKSLKYYISDVRIRIEFKNYNGNVVASQEYN